MRERLTPQHLSPLRLAAAAVALDICLVILANVGCAGFLRRPENLFALVVLIGAALVLFLLSRTRGPAAKAASVYAQVPAGVVTGLLIQPSLGLLLGIIEGAVATRALPASPRWVVLGLVVFAVSTLAGYVILKVAASLAVPDLVRC